MAKLSKDQSSGTLHPRETIFGTGSLAVANAETQVVADGSSTISLVVTGTYVGTLIVEGSIDGTNWDSVPLKQINTGGGSYVLTLASAVVGRWQGPVGPYRLARVRMSVYTSGTAVVYLTADMGQGGDFPVLLKGLDLTLTITGAAAASVVATLPAVAGMYHYIGRVIVQRFAAALLVAGATPVLVTTTNLPGTRVLSFPAEAAVAGTMFSEVIEPTGPIRSSLVNTNTVITCPATTSVIWRVTVDYYAAT